MESELKHVVCAVRHCARCGEDHESIEFKTFQKNPVMDTDGTVWKLWGLCPNLNEPVLMKYEQIKDAG